MRAHPSPRLLAEYAAGDLALEPALEFINDDELVELTPQSIRVRKKFLKEHERKRADRAD